MEPDEAQTRKDILVGVRRFIGAPADFPIHYDISTDRWEPVTQELFDTMLERLRDAKIGETEG